MIGGLAWQREDSLPGDELAIADTVVQALLSIGRVKNRDTQATCFSDAAPAASASRF
jgi:hypothetical protein